MLGRFPINKGKQTVCFPGTVQLPVDLGLPNLTPIDFYMRGP